MPIHSSPLTKISSFQDPLRIIPSFPPLPPGLGPELTLKKLSRELVCSKEKASGRAQKELRGVYICAGIYILTCVSGIHNVKAENTDFGNCKFKEIRGKIATRDRAKGQSKMVGVSG